MNKGTKILSFLALAIVCSSTWFGAAGCDVTPVNDGASTELETLLADISSARTKTDAGQEIQKLLNKTEVGVNYRPTTEPGAYAGFILDKDEIDALAEAQLQYNSGALQTHTFRSTFDELVAAHEQAQKAAAEAAIGFSAPVPQVTFDETARSLQIMARQAFNNPEAPESALLLAILAKASRVPASQEEVALPAATDEVSPVQRLLLGAWFHRYATTLPLYVDEGNTSGKGATNPNLSCPSMTPLCAKFNWQGGYKFETPAGNANLVTLSGNAKSGSWTSLVPVDRIIVKGGTSTDVILVGGSTSGSFSNVNLLNKGGQRPDISNIQFCLHDKVSKFEICKAFCLAKFIACKFSKGANCESKLTTCINGCHDQGGH